MSILTVISKKILGFFFGIISVFNKMLCFLHIKRGRKNSGSLLPMHSNTIKTEIQTSLPTNDLTEEEPFSSWDTWGDGDSVSSQLIPPNGPTSSMPGYMANHLHRHKQHSEPDPEPEPDYFGGMQPEIRKTAKILVRKKENSYNPSGVLSSRFAVVSDMPPPTDGELGTMDETEISNWSEEALEDLSWEADTAIREKKRLERERRKLEQIKKKQERDAQKFRKDSGGFSASKLS